MEPEENDFTDFGFCDDIKNGEDEYTNEELQQMSKPEAYERFTNFTYYGD